MFGARAWLMVLVLSAAHVSASDTSPQRVEQKSQPVLFNVKTLKVHNPSCEWARKCTKNCVRITREQAEKRGGVPCKVCGGR